MIPIHTQRTPGTPLGARGHSRRFRFGLVSLVMACLLLITSCGVGRGSAIELGPDDTVKVGVIPTASFAPLYIALEKGYFDEYGIKVETQVVQNAAAIAPSVLNGQLQFGTAAASPFIGAVSKGLPLKAVANSSSNSTDGSDETSLMTSPDSAIKRPKDLEGKTVAVNGLAALPHVAAMEVIARDGGDPSKVTFVAMPFPDMVGALGQGRIDAAALAEPFYSQSREAGDRQISTLYATAFDPGATTTLFFTAQPFIESNPELVENFSRAIERASNDAREDPQLVREVLVKYGNMKPQAAQTMGLPHYGGDLSPEGLTQISEVMARFDVIPEPIDGFEVINK